MWVAAGVLHIREALTNASVNCFKMALLVFQQQFPYSCWTDDLHWRKCSYKPCYCYSHCSALCTRVSPPFSVQQQCVWRSFDFLQLETKCLSPTLAPPHKVAASSLKSVYRTKHVLMCLTLNSTIFVHVLCKVCSVGTSVSINIINRLMSVMEVQCVLPEAGTTCKMVCAWVLFCKRFSGYIILINVTYQLVQRL
jgi:hypothetical protein